MSTLAFAQLRELKSLSHSVQHLLTNHLWAKVLVAMALGLLTGFVLNVQTGWLTARQAEIAGEWLALPGHLFLGLIQMIVVPLIVASVIRGIAAGSDMKRLKSEGFWLAVYFVATTILATAIGLATAYVLRPGRFIDPTLAQKLAGTPLVSEVEATSGFDPAHLPRGVVALLPENPLQAMAQGQMLQVVVFGVIFGVALLGLSRKSARPILDLMDSTQAVCMSIVGAVMRLAPLAVFGLLAQVMITTGPGVLSGLSAYALSVILALSLLLGMYLVLVKVVGRRSPWTFLKGIREAQLLAFSTGSSAATMPITVKNAEENLGIRSSTAQLVVPLGATMNMGGTACYHGLATVFLAQTFGMDLHVTALLALIVTSLGASIGAPATPGVGVLVLATVLTSAGVPLGGLALIIGLDQILERFRCVMNISGDLSACVVMDRLTPASSANEHVPPASTAKNDETLFERVS